MQLDGMPELDHAFKKTLWKKMPRKGPLSFWRSLRHSQNIAAGAFSVQVYFRTLAISDLIFDLFEAEVRSEFFWERGIGSSACESERIFKSLFRHRHKGDVALKSILLDEYMRLRNQWLATYHPTAQKVTA